TFNAGDISVTTDGSGKYTFTDVVPNKDYTVAEVTPGGYVHTAPIRSGLSANTNVNTSKRSGNQAETSIAIDPTNPNRVCVMSHDLTATGMSGSYSTDGGATWHNRLVATGGDGLIAANGDPSSTFDKFGNLWICYLTASGINTTVARSTNGGQSFTQVGTV